jgi:hypothetical protein
MPRSTAQLRVVEPLAITTGKPISPERRLRTLFRKEARLQAELAGTRVAINGIRAHYARKHGLLIWPGLDTLRRLFGAV